MTSRIKFRVDSNCSIDQIADSNICANARFVFDQQINLSVDDVLILMDGQWFIVRDNEERLLQGKWAL